MRERETRDREMDSHALHQQEEIVKRETPLGLYKGLGAVLTGIVPKMAIRFTSYESYKRMLAGQDGKVSGTGTFFGTSDCRRSAM